MAQRKKQRSAKDLEGEIENLTDELEQVKKERDQATRKIAKIESHKTQANQSSELLKKTFDRLLKLVKKQHCMMSAGKVKAKNAAAKKPEYNMQARCCYMLKRDGKMKPCNNSASFYCKNCSVSSDRDGTQGKHWFCSKDFHQSDHVADELHKEYMKQVAVLLEEEEDESDGENISEDEDPEAESDVASDE